MFFALFGINNDALNLVVNLLVLFLVVVYFALIAWTYFDAKRRMEDQVLVWCSVGASLFPFIGTVVYTILRPPEFLEDREERELELRAAELRVRQLIEQSCPHCEYPIVANYLRCPNCERRLRNPCRKCHKPLDPRWGICPYCETEVRKERPARETRRTDRQRTARAAAQRQARSERPDRADRDGGDRSDRPTRRKTRAPVAAREERPSRSSRSSSR
jgi:hypothetical protein